MATEIVTHLLGQVDTISHQFVLNGYQRLVSDYAPAIYGLVTLGVMVYGYAVLLGWTSLSLAETGKRVLLTGCVLSLALNWGMFATYIYNLFTVAPNEIASALAGAIPHANVSGAENTGSALQQTLDDGAAIVKALCDRGSFSNVFPYVWGAVITMLVLALVGIALVALIVAKFGLAIYLVLAPLAVPTILFRATKEMLFDGWLKHLVGFALVPVFVTSALTLGLTLLSDSSGLLQQNIASDDLTFGHAAPYTIYMIVALGLVIKSEHMAASIANGFSAAMLPYFSSAANTLKELFKNMLPKSRPDRNPRQNAPSNPSSIPNKG